jgi:hypothetical protein
MERPFRKRTITAPIIEQPYTATSAIGWSDQDERPTRPTIRNPDTDLHNLVGQLMVENVNHLKRIEILEAVAERVQVQNGSIPPPRHSILPHIRRVITTTALIVAAVISALKELGLLHFWGG